MKYLIILLSLFASTAWASNWTFYNPTPRGYTEWTPGRMPITTTRTQSGGLIRFDPNPKRPSHYEWTKFRQWERDHVLPHVID